MGTRRSGLVAPLLAAALALACAVGFAQQTKHSKKRSKTPAPAALAAIPVPFRAGENLDYRILFSKYAVNAGKVETTVVEQRNFFGHAAWHFRAVAHTMDTTRIALRHRRRVRLLHLRR